MGKRKKEKREIKSSILTCDPSLTAWGFCIIDTCNEKIVNSGCIETKPLNKKLNIRKGDDNVRRNKELINTLKENIKKYNVKYIISELPHGSQNANGASMIGMVIGILCTIDVFEEIPVEWYSEGDAKKALFNTHKVSKKEMQDKIGKLFKVPWIGTKKADEAISDSLAIYYTSKKNSPAVQMILELNKQK